MPIDIINRQVADLYWLCHAPGLMHGVPDCGFKKPDLAWFLELQASPDSLVVHLRQRNMHLLGTYCEALWEFLLQHNPNTDLLAKNIQVFSGALSARKTLGEMDFIYFCHHRQMTVHLEVAVKFYIACDYIRYSHSLPQDHWLGPQCNDRLDIKFQKIRDKQSCLSLTQEGQQALSYLNIQVDHAEVAMLGFLFSDFQAPQTAEQANPHHLHGVHLSLSGLTHADLSDYVWLILDKPYWLSVSQCLDIDDKRLQNTELLLQRLQRHFQISDRAVMLAAFSLSPLDKFQLQQRFFITSDQWPKINKISEHLLG